MRQNTRLVEVLPILADDLSARFKGIDTQYTPIARKYTVQVTAPEGTHTDGFSVRAAEALFHIGNAPDDPTDYHGVAWPHGGIRSLSVPDILLVRVLPSDDDPEPRARHTFLWQCASFGWDDITHKVDEDSGYQILWNLAVSVLDAFDLDTITRAVAPL